jgi:RNA polymerase sigma-70 factor (family 1)
MKNILKDVKDELSATTRNEHNEAFLNLFESFKNKVYSYCRHISHSETTAEDLTQEVFMKVWLEMSSINNVNNPEASIITIARTCCFNYLKKKAAEQKFIKVTGDANLEIMGYNNSDDYVCFKDQLNHLARVVNSLPSRQRMIFNLNRNEGLKNEEIARQLNISTHTVKSHFVKALRKVRQEMDNYSIIVISALTVNKYFF